MFLPKLRLLARHIDRQLVYFKALFFSGDRGADLGQVKCFEILRFPHDDGLLLNHIWGKTLRDGPASMFGLRRHPDSSVCPVHGIETYVAISKGLGIDLSRGYLFRPTTPQGDVIDKPISGPTASARFKRYLKEASQSHYSGSLWIESS
jgi:hypothetical protein